MRNLYFFITSISIILIGCNKYKQNNSLNTNYEEIYTIDEEFTDGTYCAEVEYYNPNTGTNNTYNLDVEVENGELVKIYWSNGGWLDESHFTPQDITDGNCSFTDDRGYEYEVTLKEKGGNCWDDSYNLSR